MHPVFNQQNDIDPKLQADCIAHGYIGQVDQYRFYEHPVYGDESPLIAYSTKSGNWGSSHWWELPQPQEILPIGE